MSMKAETENLANKDCRGYFLAGWLVAGRRGDDHDAITSLIGKSPQKRPPRLCGSIEAG